MCPPCAFVKKKQVPVCVNANNSSYCADISVRYSRRIKPVLHQGIVIMRFLQSFGIQLQEHSPKGNQVCTNIVTYSWQFNPNSS